MFLLNQSAVDVSGYLRLVLLERKSKAVFSEGSLVLKHRALHKNSAFYFHSYPFIPHNGVVHYFSKCSMYSIGAGTQVDLNIH